MASRRLALIFGLFMGRLMCSYNSVNGVPSCASKELLTKKAREQWRFDGYVTGDCGAVSDVFNTHHYTNTTGATCAVVLDAGTDIDCGSFLPANIPNAIASGDVRKVACASEVEYVTLYALHVIRR